MIAKGSGVSGFCHKYDFKVAEKTGIRLYMACSVESPIVRINGLDI